MITTEVDVIHLQEMKNAKFVDFMETVSILVSSKTPITITFAPVTESFAAMVERLKISLVAVRANSYTEKVNSADDERDKVHKGFIHLLQAYKFCNDPVKEMAAEKLFFATKQYGLGKLRNVDNDSETSLLDGLMETIKSDKFSPDIVTLPEVGTYMAVLDAAITKFKQVKAGKVSEQAQKIDYTTREVRQDIVPVYRRLIAGIEVMASVGVDPEYAEFVNELNALIAVS